MLRCCLFAAYERVAQDSVLQDLVCQTPCGGHGAYRISTSRFIARAAVSLLIGHRISLLVLLANFRTVLEKLGGPAVRATLDVRCTALQPGDRMSRHS